MVNPVTIDAIPPYEGPHAIAGIQFRPFRSALEVSAWGMNILDFDPHADGYPEHDHTADGQEEVYLVLSGTVVIRLGETERTLSAGQAIRVPPEQRRKLLTQGDSARVLAIGAAPGQAFTPTM